MKLNPQQTQKIANILSLTVRFSTIIGLGLSLGIWMDQSFEMNPLGMMFGGFIGLALGTLVLIKGLKKS